MPTFGRRSKRHLKTLHPDLVVVLNEAIEHYDFAIICGHRNKKAQNEAYATGASHVRWPYSKHNTLPSLAVDVAPWPIDWNDNLAFARLFGLIDAIARLRPKGTTLRWGGDWDGDGNSRDQTFMDLGHFELVLEGPIE